jgi:hypothetical protein
MKSNIIILFVLLAVSSCKKLIELPANPPDKIATDKVFADSINTMTAIAGIYTNFKIVNNFSLVFHNGAIVQYTGLSSDELKSNITYDVDEPGFYNNALLAKNGHVASLWHEAYTCMYQINSCLTGVQESTGISSTLKQQLTGEIKVVRALYYFNLVNLFGEVPLITGTDYKVNEKLPRASVDEIYAQIIKDLTDARTLLTSTYPSAGRARPNLYVATALLAKVYLYKKQWADAAAMATTVIDAGVYNEEQNLNNVFLHGSQEAIWQLPAIGTYSQTAEAAVFIPYANNNVPNYVLSNYLVNAFETNDARKTTWIGENIANGTSYFYPAKYKSKSPTDPRMEDYMVLRLSEQYLIRAEALAQQNKTPEAIDDLNIIRVRAGLPVYDGSSILDAIMHERQTELFCEWGNRWFDLKRTGKADEVLGAEKPDWQPTDALYPVPLTEIQSNPFLTQNLGYNN